MGLLTNLLLAPVLGPLKGLAFVFEQIHNEVEAELGGDAERVQDELASLSLLRELGEVEEGQYLAREAALLERLNALRQRDAA